MAMACNVPLISVDVGDVPKILGAVAGYSLTSRDPQEMGRRIADWIIAPDRVEGRETLARRRLDLESVARTIIDIYQSAVHDQTHNR
jgi:glycosyltransferase involved in cell wall biosynthesis